MTALLGRRLPSRRPRTPVTSEYRWILTVVMFLNVVGLLMVFSASSATSLYTYGSSWFQIERQGIWFILSLGALYWAQRFDHHRLPSLLRWMLPLTAFLMVLPLLPVIGIEVNGSARWFGFGQLRMQPSELVKLVMIVFVAEVLTSRSKRLHDSHQAFWPIVGVFGLFAALLMLEPNLGTTMILGSIMMVMLAVGGIPLRWLAALGGLLAGLAALFALLVPFRARRMMIFTDPWSDPLGAGLQTIQSQVGLANGGLFGVGFGQSRVKWGFLPEAHTDFIFSIIGEEFGLVGCAVIIGALLALAYLGVRTAMRAPDRLGMLLAVGVTTWILVQAFVNIGAVVGGLPITGVPLPFVSAGGSSLIFTMAGVGVLLNVARGTTR